MSESYKIITGSARAEAKVRGSRFIGTALPVASKEEAQGELEKIRKEFWDASHNCYAYRLAPGGEQYRFADDGEPTGSAGKPILFVLQQRELVNTLVVVTRYFGGTKLGVGGLVRAYTESAQEALNACPVEMQHPMESLTVFTPYEDVSIVRQLVEKYATTFEAEFRDVVSYTLRIRLDRVDEFTSRLIDLSQGRAGFVRLQAQA